MGWNIFRFLKRNEQETRELRSSDDVFCQELFEAAQEFEVRKIAFNTCVSMISHALARCDFRTFAGGAETFGAEAFLWNFEPNKSENSTRFLQKLAVRLCTKNDALIVSERIGGGEQLFIADSWSEDSTAEPWREKNYERVEIDGYVHKRTFRERDVLRLKLNHIDVKPVIDALFASYCRLFDAARKTYLWNNGQHWKVHVSKLARGVDGWADSFRQMMDKQLKPFLNSESAVLPEFDGYAYTNEGGKNQASYNTRDIKHLIDDIFDFTARAFLIPTVLLTGAVEGTSDATARFLSFCIDPLCDQLSEEVTRKRYGAEAWARGDYLRVDSSAIMHFDLFANAANIEKIVGSGAFSVNDARRAAGQQPINDEWANGHFLTLNIAKMNDIASSVEGGEGN